MAIFSHENFQKNNIIFYEYFPRSGSHEVSVPRSVRHEVGTHEVGLPRGGLREVVHTKRNSTKWERPINNTHY